MALVQSKQGAATPGATGGTLTITLDNPTTAGNGLIVAASSSGSTTNPTIGGITLGGSAGNFAARQTAGTSGDVAITAIWDDLNCAGGQTSVVITQSGGSGSAFLIFATVYERDDLLTSAAFDKGAGVVGTTTSWSSGATATTTAAAEVFVGAAVQFQTGTQPVLTGPSSPWVNLTEVDQAAIGGLNAWLSGYKVVASTQTATYAGTSTQTSQWNAIVATFKLAAGTDTSPAYAATATDLGGGTGSWTSPANAQGTGDTTYATWTAP